MYVRQKWAYESEDDIGEDLGGISGKRNLDQEAGGDLGEEGSDDD